MTALVWSNDKRKLSDLVPWDDNPRKLSDGQAEHLQKSLERFGLVYPFLISPDNEIYDGHQRQVVMDMTKKGADLEVDVRISSRELTGDERRELVIRLHENTGDWDFEGLTHLYDVDELGEWGFPDWKMPDYDFGMAPNLDDLEDEYGDPEERDFWPFIRVQVSPDTYKRWEQMMADIPGQDEALKMGRIIGATHAALLSDVAA